MQAIVLNEPDNLEALIGKVKEEARQKIKNKAQRTAVLAYGEVLEHSYRFWDSSLANQRTLGRTPGPGVWLADAQGAYYGATTGLVFAGPVGAVIVGANGAMMSSLFSYAITLAWGGASGVKTYVGSGPFIVDPTGTIRYR